jgi:ADP-heptose:LPS heptosyltransferase
MRRLIIRPGAIGDLIVSLPALECLKAEYLEVWVTDRNTPLIRFADTVRSIGSTGLDLLGLPDIAPSAALVEKLRSFDSITSWYGEARPEFRAAVERLRIPFEFFPALPHDAKGHAVDFYLEQLGNPASSRDPEIDCPGGRSNFAVIHPFASSPGKRWPLQKFREVAAGLKMPVQWCAGDNEDLAEAVRIDNLYDLGCWLARARVYIGNDSGISHLAAAVGTPTIVLFGPTNPLVWAPRGSRVLAPMGAVEPAEVVAAVEQMAR